MAAEVHAYPYCLQSASAFSVRQETQLSAKIEICTKGGGTGLWRKVRLLKQAALGAGLCGCEWAKDAMVRVGV